MSLKVYAYKNCGTCRKAVKFLQEHSIPYDAVPVREQPPVVGELRRALDTANGNVRKLFNTSGNDYKDLNMKDILPTLSDDQALATLAENGHLVKRPMAFDNDLVLIGFDEDAWTKALL